jgi:hypothetical protein
MSVSLPVLSERIAPEPLIEFTIDRLAPIVRPLYHLLINIPTFLTHLPYVSVLLPIPDCVPVLYTCDCGLYIVSGM